MINALIALFCAAVWAWALYDTLENEILEITNPWIRRLGIILDGYLIIYYLACLFTGTHISAFLFILAILELTALTLSNLLL